MTRILILCLSIAWIATAASAEIYTYTDENGTLVFVDNPEKIPSKFVGQAKSFHRKPVLSTGDKILDAVREQARGEATNADTYEGRLRALRTWVAKFDDGAALLAKATWEKLESRTKDCAESPVLCHDAVDRAFAELDKQWTAYVKTLPAPPTHVKSIDQCRQSVEASALEDAAERRKYRQALADWIVEIERFGGDPESLAGVMDNVRASSNEPAANQIATLKAAYGTFEAMWLLTVQQY